MKINKILICGMIIASMSNGQTLVTEEMVYGGVIDAIKRIPESMANLGNYIYKTEMKKEKSFWWYFKKNTKLKKELEKRNIDYYTILKQGMYPKKVYDNSREAEIKKYAILTALAKTNGIPINENYEKEKTPHKRKKLKIEMTDINEIKKN
jgi:hypothetical protein